MAKNESDQLAGGLIHMWSGYFELGWRDRVSMLPLWLYFTFLYVLGTIAAPFYAGDS